ncbi:zinc carboxypeptidase [Aquimarina sp. MAR_2010_214]|uniref:M14 family metallopeptidase n=1 Tax=Aquimarina sp. MAR_2010_214 TaxID=1250026 RepID=UPI000C6FD076|nr:M14 family metallopeptidase [Aquimarina sp. MAR_2010_214]PKV51475.1 zinc carboxypeptidase [Aquimarina sp. MAR_2010_214]
MKITKYKIVYIVLAFCFILLLSCQTTKKVTFETPVDTTSKKINYQVKQTYTLKDINVYASNEFNGARLNGFRQINDSTAAVIISPENTPINESAYYAFKAWTDTPKPFYFQFQYTEGHKHRYFPQLKINDQWRSIDSTDVYKTGESTTIKIKLDKTPLLIAAQEIQSSDDVKNWYTELIKQKESYANLSIFGTSKLGRNLPVLDIYKGKPENRDLIVLLTRQHPPEVTGYFAFQHFVQTILNNSELSNKFLNRYRVLAFPIMNPDGVDLGHWRHNAGGVDTNRDWSSYRQPEIRQTVQFITETLKRYNSKLILGLDFHSTWYDIFYTNQIRKGTTLPYFIEDWFTALESNISDYTVNEKPGNSKKPVSKGWFLYGHNATGVTYEIGDDTPRDKIKMIGTVTAEQMMKILVGK